jgi:LytR cell envelope-related transcriptional attenuator
MPDGISDDGRPPPAWGPSVSPSANPGADLGLSGLFADPAAPPPAAPPDPALLAAQHQAEVEAAAAAAAVPRSSGAHRARRQPARYVLPAVGGALAVVLIALGIFGWFGRDNDPTVAAPVASQTSLPSTPSASTPTSAAPTPTPTPSKSAAPSPTHTVKPPPAVVPPPPVVHAPSVVLNETQIRGLAATVAAYLTNRGWTITGLGNWHGRIGSTTVYYPPGLEAAARSMAYDLGRVRIRPRVQGMLTDRLTVVLTQNPL